MDSEKFLGTMYILLQLIPWNKFVYDRNLSIYGRYFSKNNINCYIKYCHEYAKVISWKETLELLVVMEKMHKEMGWIDTEQELDSYIHDSIVKNQEDCPYWVKNSCFEKE